MTTPTSEPEYEGKPLSHWLARCRDNEPDVRVAALNALGMMVTTSTIPVLTELLQDSECIVQEAAAEARGIIGQPASPALMELLRDEERDQFIWINATEALSKTGPAAVPAVMELIQNEEGMIRLYISSILGEMGVQAKAAIPTLIESLRSDVSNVQKGAAVALSAMGTAANAAVPAVMEMLQDDEPAVRSTAMGVLMAIVPVATVVIQTVISHANDI
ncbi:MAG: HEAT repeat domain-containing protein [Pirellulaceae bacterium]